MHLSKTLLLALTLMVGTDAFANCAKRDLYGFWHVISLGSSDGVGSVCTIALNAQGQVKSSSTCELFSDTSAERTAFDLDPSSSLTVNRECHVSGGLGEAGRPLLAIDGQMSREGEYIQGTLEADAPDDVGSDVFIAIKMK